MTRGDTMFKIYRNLKPGMAPVMWSYKLSKPGEPGSYAVTLTARNVTIKHGAGQVFEDCIHKRNGGYRAVFAWFKSDNLKVNPELSIPAEARRIRFNPKRGERVFTIDGEKIDFLRQAWLDADGNAWGIV